MAGRQALRGFLLFLGTNLVLTSCAQTDGRPNGRLGLLGKKNSTPEEERPAPALAIPGPAAEQPALPAPAQPGLLLTSAPAPPALPEVLPLRVADPIMKDIAPLPPLAAAPRPATQAAPQVVETSNPLAPLRDLYQKAADKHATLDSYTLRLRRREVVGSQNRPEELLLFKWRKEPWSVYLKWLGTEGKGREVVYVKGRYDNALHTLTAAGDIPLLPAGRRFKLSPDGMLVKSKSRYPITEAGLGGLIERFGRLVDALEKGDSREGTAKYLGQLKRPEFENKVEAVLQTIPPRSDPHLPRGGQRLWFFDPVLHLPMLLITQDETGREVEYYCHDRFMFPVNLTDDDFNPDVLWKNVPAK